MAKSETSKMQPGLVLTFDTVGFAATQESSVAFAERAPRALPLCAREY
jgi:hypothetical protein